MAFQVAEFLNFHILVQTCAIPVAIGCVNHNLHTLRPALVVDTLLDSLP